MFVKEGGKTVMMAKKCERKCVCQGGRENSNDGKEM